MNFATVLCSASELHLEATLQSGQSFRWFPIDVDDNHKIWRGVIDDACYSFADFDDGNIYVASTSDQNEFKPIKSKHEIAKLKSYFFLEENLEDLIQKWSGYTSNSKNKKNHHHPLITLFRATTATLPKQKTKTSALPLLQRIRLLKQDPIEMIFSFLCSQNNHLSRITTMINLIASHCGEQVFSGNTSNMNNEKTNPIRRSFYKFPSCEKIAKVSEEFWRNNGFGYRAKYIVETAKQIAKEGQENFVNRVMAAPTVAAARSVLLELCGIGRKVADCILLSGFGKFEVAPMDTHMISIIRSACPKEIDCVVVKKEAKALPKNENETKKNKKESFVPAQHDEAQRLFKEAFGDLAGWAQLIFFVSRVKSGVFAQENRDENVLKQSGKESGKRRLREE